MVAHEYAHGYAALKQGDPTAYQLGRLTWNPVKHIDPFLTILMPVMLFVVSNGAFMFGGQAGPGRAAQLPELQARRHHRLDGGHRDQPHAVSPVRGGHRAAGPPGSHRPAGLGYAGVAAAHDALRCAVQPAAGVLQPAAHPAARRVARDEVPAATRVGAAVPAGGSLRHPHPARAPLDRVRQADLRVVAHPGEPPDGINPARGPAVRDRIGLAAGGG